MSERSYTLEAVAIDYIPWLDLIKEKHRALRALKYGDPKPWFDGDDRVVLGAPRPGEHLAVDPSPGEGSGQFPNIDVHATAIARTRLGER